MPTQQLPTEQPLSPPPTMSKEMSIPKLEPKLAGRHSCAEGAGLNEMALGIGNGTIDMVNGVGDGSKGSPAAKNTSSEESDSNRGGAIVLNVGPSGARRAECFQYDSATTHHTTNRLDLLQNIKYDANFPIKAHDGSISYCDIIGTLVFRHNGREIPHEDCLYNPNYRNLISGQRMGRHILKVERDQATLKKGKRVIYQMDIDQRGALWIKLEKSQAEHKQANAEAIKDLYERNHDQNLPQQRALDTWKGAFVGPRSKVLKKRRRSFQQDNNEAISYDCAIYCQNDEIRDLDPRQSVRTTNLKSIDQQHAGSLVVFAVDEIRKSHFAQTRKSQPDDVRRYPKRRRGSKVTDMSQNDVGKAARRMVQLAAEHSLSVDNIGGIYRRFEGDKECSVSKTTPTTEHICSPDPEDGQQRGMQPLKDLQIPPSEPPHQAPIPLSPPTSPRTPDHTNNPREVEPCHYPHSQPDEHDYSLESFLGESCWSVWLNDDFMLE